MNRRRILASLGGGWKNPYVTNGLIAMWDGEWNAGGGVHDPNVTVWKDLSGNSRDATLSGNQYFKKNAWHNNGTSGGVASWPALNLGSDQTIEFVCARTDRDGFYTTARILAEGQNIPCPISYQDYLYFYGYGVDKNLAVSFNWGLASHSLTHKSLSTFKWRLNKEIKYSSAFNSRNSTGATTGYIGNNAGLSRGFNGDIFCIRFYNRVLEEPEIAANYAIDKARFNLP